MQKMGYTPVQCPPPCSPSSKPQNLGIFNSHIAEAEGIFGPRTLLPNIQNSTFNAHILANRAIDSDEHLLLPHAKGNGINRQPKTYKSTSPIYLTQPPSPSVLCLLCIRPVVPYAANYRNIQCSTKVRAACFISLHGASPTPTRPTTTLHGFRC